MKCVVSGGGSLAAHLDDFYEAAGLPVLVRGRRWSHPLPRPCHISTNACLACTAMRVAAPPME